MRMFIRPCFESVHCQLDEMGKIKSRANKHSHIESIVYNVTGRIQKNLEVKTCTHVCVRRFVRYLVATLFDARIKYFLARKLRHIVVTDRMSNWSNVGHTCTYCFGHKCMLRCEDSFFRFWLTSTSTTLDWPKLWQNTYARHNIRGRSIFIRDLGPVHYKFSVWKNILSLLRLKKVSKFYD